MPPMPKNTTCQLIFDGPSSALLIFRELQAAGKKLLKRNDRILLDFY
jgi:hypothetical protein